MRDIDRCKCAAHKKRAAAQTLCMKKRSMPAGEFKSRDERESCIPAFLPAEERHGR